MSWLVSPREFNDLSTRLRAAEVRLKTQAETQASQQREIEALKRSNSEMAKTLQDEMQNVINEIRQGSERTTDLVASAAETIRRLGQEMLDRIPANDTSDDILPEHLEKLRALSQKIVENADGLAAAIPAGTSQAPVVPNGEVRDFGGVKPSETHLFPDGKPAEGNPNAPGAQPPADLGAADEPNRNAGTGPDSPASRQIDESGGNQRGSAQDIGQNPGNPNIEGLPNPPQR